MEALLVTVNSDSGLEWTHLSGIVARGKCAQKILYVLTLANFDVFPVYKFLVIGNRILENKKMSDRIKESDAAGTCFRVGDPYIWVEIYYLDSRSDYREHLPQNSGIAPAARGDLTMLDSAGSSSVSKTFGLLLLIFAIIFLTAGYFLRAIIDTL